MAASTVGPEVTNSTKDVYSDLDVPSTSGSATKGQKRKRKVRCLSDLPNVKMRVEWSADEKKNLLIAIQIYGHKNEKLLASAIPTKTPAQIAFYLRSLETQAIALAKKERNTNQTEGETQACLDEWMKTAQLVMSKRKDYSQAISKAYSLIAQHDCYQTMSPTKKQGKFIKLEEEENDHAKSSEHFNAGMAEIYDYLASLLREGAPTVLSAPNKVVVSNLYETLQRIVIGVMPELQQEKELIKTISLPLTKTTKTTKTRARRIIDSQPSTSSQASIKEENTIDPDATFSLNPLNLPLDLLKTACDKIIAHPLYQAEMRTFVKTCTALKLDEYR